MSAIGSTKLVPVIVLGAALLASSCSRVDVTWTPKPSAIEVAAIGLPDADLIVLTGPPSGPLVQRLSPGAWTTVGASPTGEVKEILRARFAADGRATGTIRRTDVAQSGLIQAMVQSRTPRPGTDEHPMLAVSECIEVSWADDLPRFRSHAMVVLSSATALRLAGLVAVIVAAIAARGITFTASRRLRRGAVVVLLLVAGWLVLDQALAAKPPPRPEWAAPDPLDRVTRVGLAELVVKARAAIRPSDAVFVHPDGPGGPERRDAQQVAWRLWPSRAVVAENDTDLFAQRGAYVVLGKKPERKGRIPMFTNAAGSVWRVDEAEPR